jgi:hypothetical protein
MVYTINFSVEVCDESPLRRRRRFLSRPKTGCCAPKEALLQTVAAEEDRQAEEHPRQKKALRLAEFPMADRKEKKAADRKGGADRRKPVGR